MSKNVIPVNLPYLLRRPGQVTAALWTCRVPSNPSTVDPGGLPGKLIAMCQELPLEAKPFCLGAS